MAWLLRVHDIQVWRPKFRSPCKMLGIIIPSHKISLQGWEQSRIWQNHRAAGHLPRWKTESSRFKDISCIEGIKQRAYRAHTHVHTCILCAYVHTFIHCKHMYTWAYIAHTQIHTYPKEMSYNFKIFCYPLACAIKLVISLNRTNTGVFQTMSEKTKTGNCGILLRMSHSCVPHYFLWCANCHTQYFK